MELRRAADALVRCPNSSLTALLMPSVARWQAGKQLSCRTTQNHTIRRSFTNSRPRNLTLPSRTTTSAATAEKSEKDPKDEISQSIKNLYGAPSNSGQKAGSFGNFLRTPPTATATEDWRNRTKKPSSLSPVLPLRFRPGDDVLNSSNVSADSILKQINERTAVLDSPSRSINTDSMHMPGSVAPDVNGMREDFRSVAKKDKVTFALKPSLGRSIDITSKIDVGRGFRLLEQSCARNKVRSDFTKQRFHERPGMKRKRLGRERWRRKFMEGFKATIGRVKQMRRQGW